MKHKQLFLAVILFSLQARSQQVINLYQEVPNSTISAEVTEKVETVPGGRIIARFVTTPTLTAFFPTRERASGAAIIICPGGGYSSLVMNAEGTDIASEFVKKGVAAFVLKYRLPNSKIMPDPSIGPLQDAQQSLKLVRERAAEWNIDTAKVGIIGFSAGGHLASTASTHFNDVVIENNNGTSLRPSFSILLYPVITFTDSLLHKGSRKALIGEDFTPAQQLRFSNEKQVTPQTSPTFIVHAEDDKVVPVANSLWYYEALVTNGVKAELHIYPTGGHGFALDNKTVSDNWLNSCFNWMTDNKWIKP